MTAPHWQPSHREGAWSIHRTSTTCGGNWAWMRRRATGALEMKGCVCHHPWTLAVRNYLPTWDQFGLIAPETQAEVR